MIAKTALLLIAAAAFILWACGDTASKTGGPTVAATGPAPAYSEIAKTRETATDVQWDAYAVTLAGKQATDWPGLVTEVTGSAGDYSVSIDLDNAKDFSIQDTTIKTGDAAAAGFSKGSPVLVSGVIKEARSPMGLIVIEFADGATVKAGQ